MNEHDGESAHREPRRTVASTAIVLGLGAVWMCLWLAVDWWDAQPDPEFVPDGVPLFAWYVLATLGLAALLRWCSRPIPAFGKVAALATILVPVPLFTAIAASYLAPFWLLGLSIVAGIASAYFLARGLRSLTGETQRVAAALGIVYILVFVWVTNALDVIPDVWATREEHSAASADGRPDAESLLFEQAERIDQALADMDPKPSSRPRSFFLGFAGVGEQKVFAQEISLASRILGERYGVDHRGLALINDERDLGRAPLASVSGLRYALRGIGARMNPDRDVLFLSISSHGAQDPFIVVSNSKLPLNDLSNQDLAEALDDSGIKWRVIVISACYAGGFIDSLRNPQTIVIAAAAADRTSFGCANDRDLTYFGEAFYRDALPGARSLREAFDTAKAAIAARELSEHIDPSDPQAYFGAEMEAKLALMNPPS